LAVEELNVSNFDTSKVTDMRDMFYKCYALTELDLGAFDTSKVIYASNMFYQCTKLTSLDLSSFDTSKVTSMKQMFYKSNRLESIIVSDRFVVSALSGTDSDTNMFLNCTSLVGGNGTTYSSSHVNSEYARIDTEETPGYFTAAS
jgi:surface protein